METNRKPGKLGNVNAYLLRSFKFFDLKDESLTPVIFSIMLFINFAGAFLPDPMKPENFKYAFLTLLLAAVLNFFSIIYLAAYIKDLRNQTYDLWQCFRQVAKRLGRIIAAGLLYTAAVTVGLIAFVIPGVIVMLMLLFNTCYILDQKTRIFGALSASKALSEGHKKQIFVIFLMFVLTAFVLIMLTSLFITTANVLVRAFVGSFASTIIGIVHVRLTALMYVDLEYGLQEEEQEEDM